MWLPSLLGSHDDLIRVGARALELWRGGRRGMRLVARAPLSSRGSLYDVAAIDAPLKVLAPQVEGGRASVILESAFVPALLADTGGMLWNQPQIDALLRHRFTLAYGGLDTAVASWRVRADYRFGDRCVLGFAMPPEVDAALSEASRATGIAFTRALPALAWALDRFSPQRTAPRATCWWSWPEQDRALLAAFVRGKLRVLHPAVQLDALTEGIEQIVDAAALAAGIEGSAAPIVVGHWERGDRQPSPSSRVRRMSVESAETVSRLPIAQAAAG